MYQEYSRMADYLKTVTKLDEVASTPDVTSAAVADSEKSVGFFIDKLVTTGITFEKVHFLLSALITVGIWIAN